MEGVEAGGGSPPPEGDYLLEIKEVTREEGSNSGEPYLSFVWKVAEGRHEGKQLWDNCSLQPQALWRLRQVLEAIGLEVPPSEMDIFEKDLVGGQAMGTIEHEEYKNKTKARLVDIYPPDGNKSASRGKDDDEEEDEKPARRRASAKDDDEEDEKPARRRSSKDDDEEDEKPARRRSRVSKEDAEEDNRSSKKADPDDQYAEDEIRDMNEKTLQKVVDTHELDLDLTDFATLRRKQAAIIDALEDQGLMK